MSGLVHRIEQVDVQRIVAFTCPRCSLRHTGQAKDEILELSADGLRCPSCLLGGLEANYWGTVEERFPEPLPASFAVLPNALQDHAAELGLQPHDLLVIWALDRHRRDWGHEVYPSQETIARHVALSVHQVRRALGRLVKAKLIEWHQPGADGKRGRGSTRYDLSPLWLKLADLAGKTATQPCAPNGQIATQGRAPNAATSDDHQFATQTDSDLLRKSDAISYAASAPEVEVRRRGLEGEPVGTSAATSADARAGVDDSSSDEHDPDWQTFLAWKAECCPDSTLMEARRLYQLEAA